MGLINRVADAIEGRNRKHENVGRRFHSPFFQRDIIVTAYKNNREWWFMFPHGTREHRARTALSYFITKGYEKKED